MLSDPYSDFITTIYGIMIIIYLIAMSVSIGIAVAQYVLESIGLKGMLSSLGFEKTWYAFVPFCNLYVLGWIADKYDDRKEKTNYAKKLLKQGIVAAALTVVSITGVLVLVIVANVLGISESSPIAASGLFILAFFAIYGLYIAMMVILVIFTVNHIKASWRLYRIFAPSQSILFLMLSIFISPARAIIFFLIRGRAPQNLRVETPPQYGMPYNCAPNYPQYQTYVENDSNQQPRE